MNAPLKRLDPIRTADDRRREPRYSAVYDASLRNMRGDSCDALLLDVSLHGACLRSAADWVRVGSFVSVAIGETDAIGGVVRWLRDGSAGVEFLHPVPAEREEWHALMSDAF